MEIKFVFQEEDTKKISLKQFCCFIEKLNINKSIEAHVRRIGSEIEVIVTKIK